MVFLYKESYSPIPLMCASLFFPGAKSPISFLLFSPVCLLWMSNPITIKMSRTADFSSSSKRDGKNLYKGHGRVTSLTRMDALFSSCQLCESFRVYGILEGFKDDFPFICNISLHFCFFDLEGIPIGETDWDMFVPIGEFNSHLRSSLLASFNCLYIMMCSIIMKFPSSVSSVEDSLG